MSGAGKGMKPNTDMNGRYGSTSVMPMKINVLTSNSLPGRLRKKRCGVRTTSAMTSSVNSDSMNPAGVEPFRRSVEQKQQRPEGQKVKDRTNQAEEHHVVTDEGGVPAARFLHPFRVHIVAGDGCGGNIGKKVVEQICGASRGRNDRSIEARPC